jgi:general secretion pathway protein B
MSILLEALRKSEKSQRQHSVPTIHSDDQAGKVSASFSLWPFILTIATVLVVAGWVAWRQYQVPPGVYQPPVTLAPGSSTKVAGDAGSQNPAAEAVPGTPPRGKPTDSSKTKQRTPVESYQEPVQSKPPPAPAGSKPPPAPAGSTALTGQAASKPPDNEVDKQPASNQASSSKPASVTPAKKRPHQPEPIGYWELPDSVRSKIPEIKFSVLVYANDPKDRFVLINGERVLEGDSLQAGLVVKEIRRDGVLFSYRLYRFLVER